MRRRPLLACGITLLLACPIAMVLLSSAFLNGVVVQPLPYAEPHQLVGLSLSSPNGTSLGFSGPDFHVWKDQARSLSGIAAYDESAAIVQSGDLAERVDGAEASSNLADVLAASPLVGRFLTPDEDRIGGAPVVVIGHGLWQRAFAGDQAIVGRSIRLGGINRTIVGVMRPGFSFPRTSEYWIPILQDASLADRSNFDMSVLGRIAPGSTYEEVAAEARLIVNRLASSNTDRAGYVAMSQPLRSVLIASDLGRIAFAISLATGLLVCLAGVSVTGLFVADARRRQREMSIRAALGAERLAIIVPIVAEAMLYWGIATVVAVVMSSVASGLVSRGLPAPVAALFLNGWDWRVLTLGVGGCLIFSLILGVGSALRLVTRAHAVPGLANVRGDAAAPSSGFHGGPVLVSAAATSLLLFLGLAALSYVNRITTSSLGFRPEGVSVATYQILGNAFPLRDERVALAAAALNAAREVRGVTGVAGATRVPGLGVPLNIAVERRDQTGPLTVQFSAITRGFFETLEIRVVEGREFDLAEHAAREPRVAVVSQSLATRLWPNGGAIGQHMRVGTVGAPPPVAAQAAELRIVGVVADVRGAGYQGELAHTVYTPLSYFPAFFLSVFTRASTSGPADAAALRSALGPLGADIAVFRAAPLLDSMSDAMWMPIAVSKGLTIIALAGLIIAFGSIGTAVYFRSLTMQHELAVRSALGATPRQVLARLAGRPAALTVVGTLAGLACGIAAMHLLPTSTGRPAAPPVALAVLLIVSVSAICAMSLPAVRTLRADVRELLRGG